MPSFNPEINLDVILALLAIIISLIFTLHSIRENTAVRRASLLKELVLHFHDTDDLKTMFFEIEWGSFKFDSKTFPQSLEEKKLTYLVDFLDIIGHFESVGILKLEDLKRNLGYIAIRISSNEEVKKYFSWLDAWFENKMVNRPSLAMRELARKVAKEI